MINSYIALDIETTGLNPAEDKIIEIGMARVIEGNVTAVFSQLINPGFPLSHRITELTGINDLMLYRMPDIKDVIYDVIEFAEDFPILGHNVIFDYSFIKKAAINEKYKFEKEGIDTLKIARRVLPEIEHKNLDYLCQYFKVDPGNSHRALDDALSANKIYEKLYHLKPEDSGFKETLRLNYSVKKDTPITPAQISYLSVLIRKHNIPSSEQIENLTKSKASKMIDGIISEFGK